MAEYENPRIPEGINVSPDHPLKDFFSMAAGIGAITVIAVVMLSLLAGYLARLIPFEVEQRLAATYTERAAMEESAGDRRIRTYLQELADRLAPAQDLPEGMTITVHYADSPLINAFATLGGHVVINRGLIDRLTSENALAMVMAHEMAHIRNRDPIVALGRGVTVLLALMSTLGLGDGEMAQSLVGQLGELTALGFSRSQESAADLLALQTLQSTYGHLSGADELFALFVAQQSVLDPPLLLSTHPMSEDRLQQVRDFQREHPPANPAGPVPLPAWLVPDSAPQ